MTFFDKTKQVEFWPVGLLKLVQEKCKYSDSVSWPFCDVKGCWNRATKLYGDEDHKAFCLCNKHQQALVSLGERYSVDEDA